MIVYSLSPFHSETYRDNDEMLPNNATVDSRLRPGSLPLPGESHPTCVAFIWPVTDKHDVIHNPEVHNISQRRQGRPNQGHRQHALNIWSVDTQFLRYASYEQSVAKQKYTNWSSIQFCSVHVLWTSL